MHLNSKVNIISSLSTVLNITRVIVNISRNVLRHFKENLCTVFVKTFVYYIKW